jgi:hypothetical protein
MSDHLRKQIEEEAKTPKEKEELTKGYKKAKRHVSVGMDLDVWKSELSVFVSAKNANMDIHIRIRF